MVIKEKNVRGGMEILPFCITVKENNYGKKVSSSDLFRSVKD